MKQIDKQTIDEVVDPQVYEFADGDKIRFEKLDPRLATAALASLTPPSPPVQRVKVRGQWQERENPADPNYIAMLELHSVTSFKRMLELYASTADYELSGDDRERLAEARERYAEFGVELPANDVAAFMLYVKCGPEEFEAFSRFLQSVNEATAENVEASRQKFRGKRRR